MKVGNEEFPTLDTFIAKVGKIEKFTGLLHFIPPIKAGAEEFLTELAKNYVIKIFTTRNGLIEKIDNFKPNYKK